MPMTKKGRLLVPATVPFWLKPASTFGLLSMTMFLERSPGFALPSILAPLRLCADRDIGPSRVRCQPVGCGCIVRRRCTSRYLPAHLRRVVYLYPAGNSVASKSGTIPPFHHLCEGALPWYPTSFSTS